MKENTRRELLRRAVEEKGKKLYKKNSAEKGRIAEIQDVIGAAALQIYIRSHSSKISFSSPEICRKPRVPKVVGTVGRVSKKKWQLELVSG